MSTADDLTFEISPSEAFLLALAHGEYVERVRAEQALGEAYRMVFGKCYRPPSFYAVLKSRFEPYFPACLLTDGTRQVHTPWLDADELMRPMMEYIEKFGPELPWKMESAPPRENRAEAEIVWASVGDQQVGVSHEKPRTVYSKESFSKECFKLKWLMLDPNLRKSFFDMVVCRMRHCIELPSQVAILYEVVESCDLADWERVIELFQSGSIAERVPLQKDQPKHIDIIVQHLLQHHTLEQEAGHRAGILIANSEIFRQELVLLRQALQQGENPFDLVDELERELIAELDSAPFDLLQELEKNPGSMSSLDLAEITAISEALSVEGERPTIDLSKKVGRSLDSFLELPLVRNTTHAERILELLIQRPIYVYFGWEPQYRLHRYRPQLSPRTGYHFPGFYFFFDWSPEELDEKCEEWDAAEQMIWTAIGAILGDLAKRDRAFSEEEAAKVLPRHLTPFKIESMGQLREKLRLAEFILASGKSQRGSSVVTTLMSSLEVIAKSAFPHRQWKRGTFVKNCLDIAKAESAGRDAKLLAYVLLFLWKGIRGEAVHESHDYSDTEARAVYSLFQLSVELYERVGGKNGGTGNELV